MLADEASFQDAALPDRHLASGVAHGQRQGDADALCAFDHVCVGHDVASRVNDYSRADRVLADNKSSLGPVVLALVERPVSGHENLHHRRRNPRSQTFQRAVELD